MTAYRFRAAQTTQDIHDMLDLQAANHKSVVSQETKRTQGFVTVKHDFEVLRDMNEGYPAAIARDVEGKLVGYALSMHPTFGERVPILWELFMRLERSEWKGRPITDYRWLVMGQICVAEAHRGNGVFDHLYAHLCNMWQAEFDLIVTEVSEDNPRSMRAHERVGFELIQAYTNPETGEGWRMIGLETRKF